MPESKTYMSDLQLDLHNFIKDLPENDRDALVLILGECHNNKDGSVVTNAHYEVKGTGENIIWMLVSAIEKDENFKKCILTAILTYLNNQDEDLAGFMIDVVKLAKKKGIIA